MDHLHTALVFIVQEGTLLAFLFLAVAFAVALAQQGLGQRLNDALGSTSLETGAVLAAAAGAVTPFCSCSTVPVLSGMLRARLRFGVCFTFLIASPVINEGVLLVLLREFSWATALVFLLVAGGLSVVFGVLVDRMGMARYVRLAPAADTGDAVRISAGGTVAATPWAVRVRFAAHTAVNELRGAAPYLAVGIAVGAVIYGYVPEAALVELQHRFPGWVLILVMAVAGVPFYVNATMVVPIALALLTKGISIGPVAAFLVSAAGTSVPEMILLAKLFKAPLVVSHMLAIVLSATFIGLALEWATRLF